MLLTLHKVLSSSNTFFEEVFGAICGIFHVFHQYFPAEANLDLISPPSTDESLFQCFFPVHLCHVLQHHMALHRLHKRRKVENTERRNRDNRKIHMVEFPHARDVC